MNKGSLRRAGAIVAIGVCGAILASTSPAVAQDDDGVIDLEPIPRDQVVGPFKIDEGSYEGAISQSFVSFLSRSSLTLRMHRDAAGIATFSVQDDEMTGEWSMSETGGLTVVEHPGLAEADVTGEASGTLSGSFPYTLVGTFGSDVTATASAAAVGGPSISATDSSSDSIDLSFEFTETVQICGQVQANWDQSFSEWQAGFGWDPHVKTQLVVFPETGDDEIQTRIADLVEYATFAANQMTDADSGLVFMVDALLQAEELMSDIDSYPDTCPLDPAFLRVINQIVRDMMNSLLDHWDAQDESVRSILLRKVVEVGLRGGILGSGSVDPQAAEYLEDRITTLLQETYDTQVDGDFDEDELRQALVVANMLGYELSAELSNEDLCLALGGC